MGIECRLEDSLPFKRAEPRATKLSKSLPVAAAFTVVDHFRPGKKNDHASLCLCDVLVGMVQMDASSRVWYGMNAVLCTINTSQSMAPCYA